MFWAFFLLSFLFFFVWGYSVWTQLLQSQKNIPLVILQIWIEFFRLLAHPKCAATPNYYSFQPFWNRFHMTLDYRGCRIFNLQRVEIAHLWYYARMLSRTNFLNSYQLLGFFSPHQLAFLWMFRLLKDTKQLIAV